MNPNAFMGSHVGRSMAFSLFMVTIGKIMFAALLSLISSGCAVNRLPPPEHSPKNIIIVIGDGMGPQQLGLLAASERFDSANSHSETGLLSFARSAEIGAHTPFSHKTLVNDSACSATQLSSGCSCSPQQVGIDFKGKPCRGIMEIAHEHGKITGVVSDSRATHATPAGFGVHEEDRDSDESIAEKLAYSDLDIILSGGLDYFLPKTSTSMTACAGALGGKRSDERSLLEVFRGRGYSILCKDDDLQGAVDLPVVGLFARNKMSDAFVEGMNGEPTLVEMTQRALALADNPRGFVLMVEAGQIDWAGHANDVGWLLAEMRRLDRVMTVISDFVKRSPDTLVVVTGDHETGGFGFSYKRGSSDGKEFIYRGISLDYGSAAEIAKIRLAQKPLHKVISDFFARGMSTRDLKLFQRELLGSTGLSLSENDAKRFLSCVSYDGKSVTIDRAKCEVSDFYPYEEYSPSAVLGRYLAPRLNVVWATGTHTSTPVLVFAKGPGAEKLRGFMETTQLGRLLAEMSES